MGLLDASTTYSTYLTVNAQYRKGIDVLSLRQSVR
jgi:hypothetical protein